MQNAKYFLVAATLEKAKTYVFTEPLIRDREVGGSNPLAPTIFEERPLKSSGLLLSTLLRVVLPESFLP